MIQQNEKSIQTNYAPDHRYIDRIIEQFPSNDIQPSTDWTPQSQTLIRKSNLIPNYIQLEGKKIL